MVDRRELDRRGLLHLLVVYIVWGSTYLAIRVAVRDGAGFPPFTLAFLRVLVASVVLLGWARLKGERLRLRDTFPGPGRAILGKERRVELLPSRA